MYHHFFHLCHHYNIHFPCTERVDHHTFPEWMEVNTGDSVTITCNSVDTPKWFFQQLNPLPHNTTTHNQFLLINPVSTIHEGIFTCLWTAVVAGIKQNFLSHSVLYAYGMG